MSEGAPESPGRDGFQVYTEKTLKTYDFIVHGLSNRLAWKCPTREIQNLYKQCVSARHLEIGVGTGLFLDRLDSNIAFDSLVLADPNRTCLARTASRLERFKPESIELNLLDVSSLQALKQKAFDSIGLNYVLHCLPGGIENLDRFLPTVLQSLSSDGKFFGSTILGDGYRRNWLAVRLMDAYNRRGIFGNSHDRFDRLQCMLARYFSEVDVCQRGCVAFFSCSGIVSSSLQ